MLVYQQIKENKGTYVALFQILSGSTTKVIDPVTGEGVKAAECMVKHPKKVDQYEKHTRILVAVASSQDVVPQLSGEGLINEVHHIHGARGRVPQVVLTGDGCKKLNKYVKEQ